jgi:hypothetical protein
VRMLEVSDRWRELCQKYTWSEIFESTVAKHPEKEALVFRENRKGERDVHRGWI